MIKSILLIDDDKINNYLNELVLTRSGISESIITLNNGKEGIDFLKHLSSKENIPELILLDINMPIMDGFDFMKEFRNLNFEHKDNIHIVVLTTSTDPNDIKKMRDLGITQFLNKPLSEETLKKALKNISMADGSIKF